MATLRRTSAPRQPARLRVLAAAAGLPAAALPAEADAGPDWGAARCLIGATAVAGCVGVPLGLLLGYWAATGQMAAAPWAGLVQAHGQTQLFGWIGLAVLGVTFHAMAHLFAAPAPPARLAAAVLALQITGVALRVAAPFAPASGAGAASAWLLAGSAVAFVGAFAITLVAHAGTLSRRARTGERRAPAILPRFLLVGLALWFVALLVNLDGAIEAVRFGPAAAGALRPARDAFIVAAVSNGLAMVAAGMSLRVVVGWIDLPPPDLRRAEQAWWPLAGGALLRALAPGLASAAPAAGATVGALGNALWALGVFWYLPALRGLWAPATVRAGGGARGDADPPLAYFVRAAYGWFAVAGAFALAEAGLVALGAAGLGGVDALGIGVANVADAGRHALLFGFLGTLTAGLAGRLPGAFLDVDDVAFAATRTPYRAAWLCLLGATVLRAAAPLLAGAGRIGPTLVALAGVLGMLGLGCLLIVLGRTALLAVARERALAARLRPAT